MNILIFGSLGPNQDRILALAKLGHQLIYGYSEFQPETARLESQIVCFPLVRRNLPELIRSKVAQYEVNVVYSLLNVSDGSTEATLELLDSGLETPIVRHYKEHPCVPTVEERRALLETEGQIYINERSFEYFSRVYSVDSRSADLLDADMIAGCYMLDNFAPKLSLQDGEPHLLVAGGMSMLNDRFDVRDLCVEMNSRKVHVHLYGYMVGEDTQGTVTIHDQATQREYETLASAMPYTHLHEYIARDQFSAVWSKYDAGFMHSQVSGNKRTAEFEQMNLPCRYTAYLAAGLPLVVPSTGQEAMKELSEKKRLGLMFTGYADLAAQLRDAKLVAALTKNARSLRHEFSFDHSAERLGQILQKYA